MSIQSAAANMLSGNISFHTNTEEKYNEIDLFPEIEDGHKPLFGTLTVVVGETPITKTPIAILFDSDVSGSMGDVCVDGRTKIQHIKHTMIRIISYCGQQIAENPGTKISVGIIAFDDTVTRILEFVEITDSNADELNAKIEQMMQKGMTNIELALKESNRMLTDYMETQDAELHTKYVHIQLTDGDANIGSKNPTILKQHVNPDFHQIFVGFGKTHNAPLLIELANSTYGEYKFIDQLEKSAEVYSDFMTGVMYTAVDKAVLRVVYGEIYNATTNSWVTEMPVSNITSGANRTFHVRTTTPYQISVFLHGETTAFTHETDEFVREFDALPELIYADGVVETTNLVKYVFRQRVQELLYQIQHSAKTDIVVRKQLKKDMRELYKKIDVFYAELMTDAENTVFDQLFVKQLKDDIFISYSTMGTQYEQMYTASRAGSNNRQCSYNVTLDETEPENQRSPQRQHAGYGLQRHNAYTAWQDDGDDSPKSPRYIATPYIHTQEESEQQEEAEEQHRLSCIVLEQQEEAEEEKAVFGRHISLGNTDTVNATQRGATLTRAFST
jgi:uncharacterized protein YegL